MKKGLKQVIQNHYKLDSLLGYIFISLILTRLLTAFPGLPYFISSAGRIIQTVLLVSLLTGVAVAVLCGIVDMIQNKKTI